MNKIGKFFIIFSIIFAIKVESYRILAIFPLAFKSHNIFFMSFMNGLAKKGHQVDVISYYEHKNPHKNYKTVINLRNLSYDHPVTEFETIEQPIAIVADIVVFSKDYYGVNVCNLMAHEELQKFLRNPPTNPSYDIVITEGLSTNCYYGIGPFLNIPIVVLSACLELAPKSIIMGNPQSTAFYPSLYYKRFGIKTFWDRMENTLKSLINSYRYMSYTENQSAAMKKHLGPNIPTVREVEKMVSLFFINTFYTLHGVRPIIPEFIEVGGLHIEEDDSTLTPKLKQWMDESTHGVILFSFGTLVNIESLPNNVLPSIISIFAKLAPMRVLIKSKTNTFPVQLPNNVIAMKWIPQISVLRHPNIKLFISHGGIHSVMEAVYFGIPVIGTPLFYDQIQNIEMLVSKNMCISIKYEEISESKIDKALQEILSNSKYRKAAKYQSQIFRDRPLHPRDAASYWIEYIIKNGAQSLRSPSADLHWWQMNQLDVYGFLLLCMTLIIVFIAIIINKLLSFTRKLISNQKKKRE